jgi:hypothetical protein
MNNLKIGTRIFYRGDGANDPYFAEIIAIDTADNRMKYKIKSDGGAEKLVDTCYFSDSDLSSSFVTESAYKSDRNKKKQVLLNFMEKMMGARNGN